MRVNEGLLMINTRLAIPEALKCDNLKRLYDGRHGRHVYLKRTYQLGR